MSNKGIKLLMQYSDSEDDDSHHSRSPSPPKDRRRSRHKSATESKESDVDQYDNSKNVRRRSQHRSPKHASPESESRPRRDSEWMDDEDDFDFDDRSDRRENASLREPPPPARPDDFRTCSPSPAARSPTPAVSSSANKMSSSSLSKMPRVESQTLVSYDAPNEEDGDSGTKGRKKRRSEDGKPQHISVSNLKAEGGSDHTEESSGVKTSDNTPTTTAADDLDPYSLLDKCLEKGDNEMTIVDSPEQSSSPNNSQIIALPPEPTVKCSPELERRFVDFFVKKIRFNYDFNKQIQQRKDFRNPSIYEKLIEHFNLDELGSNFDPEIFNPRGFKSTDYYDEIAKAQSVLMSKVEKEKTGTKEAGAAATSVTDDSRKRKSKWDNPDKAKAKN